MQVKDKREKGVDMLRHVGKRKDEGPAMLPCAERCGRWVAHDFTERRQVGVRDGGRRPDFGLFYRCRRCGAERMWGRESATTRDRVEAGAR